MKIIISLIILLVLYSSSFAQIQSKKLAIYSITEYIDGYVIKAIDFEKSDTINIISVKDTFKSNIKFKRMIVGEKYNFEYEDYVSRMAAVSPNSFVIRIKTTVVWRDRDNNKERPVFAKNTRGIWIKK